MNEQLAGKNVLVVGFGRSGAAAANLLLAAGSRVRITDLRSEAALSERLAGLSGPVTRTLGRHLVEDFLQSDLIVLSPGVPSDIEPLQQAQSAGVPIWSEVELAYRFLHGSIIGITGSNGKTTTTELVGQMFRDAGKAVSVAGNVGIPLCETALLHRGCNGLVHVVELSSFQLENIHQFRCHHAALLNITPDHLDRHRSLEAYASAKFRIFENQESGDWAILNGDDSRVWSQAARIRGQLFPFSRRRLLKRGVFVSAEGIIQIASDDGVAPLMSASKVSLRGAHNLENVLAACALGYTAGLPLVSMKETFLEFKGVLHRLEQVATVAGVTFVNDSKATNVDSACKAIEAFDEPLLIILGGRDKGSDFSPLIPLLKARCKQAFLIGEAAETLAGHLSDQVPFQRCGSLAETIEAAYSRATEGDVVLLAPACASFDMFENFEDRGNQFRQQVLQMAGRVREVQS